MAENRLRPTHGSRRRSSRRLVADETTYSGGQAAAIDTHDRAGAAYSVFVRFLKMTLPGIAILILSLAIMWPSLSRTGDAVERNVRANNRITADQLTNFEMINPVFEGTDENNRPFRLRAKRARQANARSDKVTLQQPRANINLESGNYVAVSARQGRYLKKQRILFLIGDVNVFHDGNYTFRTSEATVNLKTRAAWGDKPVVALAPKVRIEARGFRVIEGGQVVKFLGKSKVILQVNQGDMDAAFGPFESPSAGKKKTDGGSAAPGRAKN